MKVGTQQAAELTGKSRSTIQRAIKSGRLPAEENALGQKIIEVAELERVYGLVKETPNAANKDKLELDPNLVYPSQPPQSPHLCWLNIFLSGIAQIIFGQISKGIALLVATLVLWLVELGWMITLLSIIDAYMVGKALQSDRPVGKWELFPT
jgi:excisionase family DNA binding protein